MVEVTREGLAPPDSVDQACSKHPRLFLVNVSLSAEAAAVAIGDYILLRGKMDILPDFVAERLTDGTEDRDQFEQYLATGLSQASHIMVLVSPEATSPWRLKRVMDLVRECGEELAFLTLKGVYQEPDVPKGSELLRGIKSLNEYIFRVSPHVDRIIFNNPEYGGLMAHTAPNHPLDAFLDWDK